MVRVGGVARPVPTTVGSDKRRGSEVDEKSDRPEDQGPEPEPLEEGAREPTPASRWFLVRWAASALLAITGSRRENMDSPDDVARQVAIGISVLTAAGVAAVSAGSFGYFGWGWTGAGVCAALWGLTILTIDVILSAKPVAPEWVKRVPGTVLRCALSASVAVLMATYLLMLALLRPVEEHYRDVLLPAKADEAAAAILGTPGNPGSAPEYATIATLEEEAATLDAGVAVELAAVEEATRQVRAESDNGGCGPACRVLQDTRLFPAQERLRVVTAARDSRRAEIEGEIAELRDKVESRSDDIRERVLAGEMDLGDREEVLEALLAGDAGYRRLHHALLAFVILIETAPVLAKATMPTGQDRRRYTRKKLDQTADQALLARAEGQLAFGLLQAKAIEDAGPAIRAIVQQSAESTAATRAASDEEVAQIDANALIDEANARAAANAEALRRELEHRARLQDLNLQGAEDAAELNADEASHDRWLRRSSLRLDRLRAALRFQRDADGAIGDDADDFGSAA